ncbi:hypothetical protein TSAR_017005 [Trichomalopsis sarcophagae]|uniref:Peptidoglycan binding-like domain-containing protein n=1 Tax=Trichomalopsis sarcophagae TaxID=543379 RepID=A0A232FL65_9HYME|nr:hypothetical protein TSAR_017005 [Trichomalopsis sarcophagae]
MKFGYLPQSGLETGNLRTDDQLRDAIRSLQKFGGIPETGQVDERTQQLMVRRRCGLPDKPDLRLHDPSLLRRFKRYTLHGSPWKHLNLTWR